VLALFQYSKLRELQRQSYIHYFYEATVGAGLPIISTLRGLVETGDKIVKVEGIFRCAWHFDPICLVLVYSSLLVILKLSSSRLQMCWQLFKNRTCSCSGTLSYIFNSFNGEKAFSQIVKEAKAAGYTEPDPRDDLSGMDVARKV